MSLSLLLAALAADPIALTSRIEDVTVYPSTALVHRAAAVTGAGSYALRGLPENLDPGSVRVRCDRGAVVSVEVRERLQEAASSERVEAVRKRLEAAQRELRGARDGKAVVVELGKHLQALMRLEQAQQHDDARAGRPSPDAWEASWTFFTRKLGENKAAERQADLDVAEKERIVAEIEKELGRMTGAGPTTVRDVLVGVEGEGATRVDVEYLVHGAGWEPLYELRTASDLSKVAMTYRARVFQRTGEDWPETQLALSTAQPQRGAQGPDPEPVWLSLWRPPPPSPSEKRRLGRTAAAEAEAPGELAFDRRVDFEAGEALRPSFAGVESQGVTVRFQLPRKETVQSRPDPTSVLVGQADLEVAIERHCVPSLDLTVWLRGKARNTSVWTMLPGMASVFLGQDYLGSAGVELVQPGQELTLHLGADPNVEVERTRTQDLTEGPGFLSSRASKIEGWRVHVENHGAPSREKDGSVVVFVREVLPRPRDERIEVELSKAEPKVSTDERWKQDREEKGFQTWALRVPRNGAADILWESTVRYPKDERVVRE